MRVSAGGSRPVTAFAFLQLILEVVTEYDILADQAVGEDFVVHQLWPDFAECLLVFRVIAQRPICQTFEHFQAGTLVPLGKNDIEADDVDFVMVEQVVDDARQLVSTPGPAAVLCEGILVDVDDYDAIVDAIEAGEIQAGVVGPVFQLFQERILV
jgi:hypothetical protein